jgi:hypothetical protein
VKPRIRSATLARTNRKESICDRSVFCHRRTGVTEFLQRPYREHGPWLPAFGEQIPHGFVVGTANSIHE